MKAWLRLSVRLRDLIAVYCVDLVQDVDLRLVVRVFGDDGSLGGLMMLVF